MVLIDNQSPIIIQQDTKDENRGQIPRLPIKNSKLIISIVKLNIGVLSVRTPRRSAIGRNRNKND